MTAIQLISTERERQINVEGWRPAHDLTHSNGELARAAAYYAMPARYRRMLRRLWPSHWRCTTTPKDRVRELVKAGALIAAEIERLQMAAVR